MNKLVVIFILIAIVSFACNENHDSHTTESDNEHEHEDVKLKLVSYNENLELYAEADGFVTGKESNILAHFTRLSDFSPLDSAVIHVRLTTGNNAVEQTLAVPTKKGIYNFKLKPETAGTGDLVFTVKKENQSDILKVQGITVYATEEEADEAAEKAEPSKTNVAVFTKEQTWKIDFATSLPTNQAFGEVIKTTGKIMSAQGDESVITAKTSGIVNFAISNLMEGQNVAGGQVLCSISGNGFADNNSTVKFTEAKSNFEKAELNYNRLRELAAEKIVSDKELQNARFDYENAKAVYENLNRNFDAKGQSIASPFPGFVKQLFVQNGQFVEPGQPVAIVSQNKNLVIQAEVQQKYSPVLASVHSATISTIYNNQKYSLEELNGKILSYGKSVNPDNFMIPVNIQIDNRGNFIPGSFVDIYLKTKSNSQALTVPNSALIEEQGIYFVYVQITPELFEKREIKTGESDGFLTEILSGLRANERIVTKGAVLIKLAQATGSLDAHSGHVH